jgi:hypothetical protein
MKIIIFIEGGIYMKKTFENAKTHLMTGVSYMLPFVVAGGHFTNHWIITRWGRTRNWIC